jgi:hypothetical protein
MGIAAGCWVKAATPPQAGTSRQDVEIRCQFSAYLVQNKINSVRELD